MKRRELFAKIRSFWVYETTGEAAACFRIALGAISLWTTLGIWLNRERYFSDSGLVPWRVVERFDWTHVSLFSLAPHSPFLPACLALALLAASCGLLLGVLPRASALVIFAVHVSLSHRNPYVFNSGDRLFSMLAGFSCFLPIGSHRTLARSSRAPAPAVHVAWAQRLVQLQICHVYWYSCFAKLRYAPWIEGRAMEQVLSSPLFSEWPMNLGAVPSALLTWSTLLFEFAFPVLVWHRKARPFVLASGVLFHLGIDLLMMIPMFSAIMIASYALFLRDEEAARALAFFDWRARARRSRALSSS